MDGQGGDPGQGRRPGLGEVDPVGQVGHLVLGDGDKLGPGAVVDPWAHAWHEPEHRVPGRAAADPGVDLLDDPGVVAPHQHRELVGEHVPEVAGGDAGVDRVDRGGGPPAPRHLATAPGFLLDGFRAVRAHPLPEPPLTPRQVYRAMLTLGRRSAGT